MDVFGNLLYILLGIVSFALVAFFAWATWNGGREEKKGAMGTPEQPGPTPAPPTETTPPPAKATPRETGRA